MTVESDRVFLTVKTEKGVKFKKEYWSSKYTAEYLGIKHTSLRQLKYTSGMNATVRIGRCSYYPADMMRNYKEWRSAYQKKKSAARAKKKDSLTPMRQWLRERFDGN